jgi:hypothetical protein
MAGEVTLSPMTPLRRATDRAPSGVARFDERLSVPWWWALPTLLVIALVAFSLWLGHPGVPAWVCPVVLVPAAAAGLIRLGRYRVSVIEHPDGPALRVGPAVLPTSLIAGATAVPSGAKQHELGPRLDPGAYVLHRPWIGPLARIELDDPEDPTPYWVFSVRHPRALLAALEATKPP